MTSAISRDNTIVILRFSALGDVAMTIPIVYSAANAYPCRKFVYYTRAPFARLFINKPSNLEVKVFSFSKSKLFDGSFTLLKELCKLKPKFLADLHNVPRTWLIDFCLWLLGTKIAVVDKCRSKRRYSLANKIQQRDFIDRYKDTFQKLGFNFNITFTSIFKDEKPLSPIHINYPAIGIAPFARYYNKTYPIELMEEVINQLTNKGINVYLFGGKSDEKTMSNIAAKYSNCTSVAGKYKLNQEMAIMANLNVVLSMDSANQHIASLTGTKVYTIWGSTTPLCGFRTWGQPKENSLQSNVTCQPCSIAGSASCKFNSLTCLNMLPPHKIVEHILNGINDKKSQDEK